MPAVLDAPAAPTSAAPSFGAGTAAFPPSPLDRRGANRGSATGAERRQFGTSHDTGRPEVDELAEAVDRYKLENRRRFITYAELYDVMIGLGYDRP